MREHKYISSVTALSHGYGGDYVHQTQPPNMNIPNGAAGGMNGVPNGLEFNFTMNVSFNKKYTVSLAKGCCDCYYYTFITSCHLGSKLTIVNSRKVTLLRPQ